MHTVKDLPGLVPFEDWHAVLPAWPWNSGPNLHQGACCQLALDLGVWWQRTPICGPLSLIFFAYLRSNLGNGRVGRTLWDRPAVQPFSSQEIVAPRGEGASSPRSHRELQIGLALQASFPDPKSRIPSPCTSSLCRSLPHDAGSNCFASEQHCPMRTHISVSTEKGGPRPRHDRGALLLGEGPVLGAG